MSIEINTWWNSIVKSPNLDWFGETPILGTETTKGNTKIPDRVTDQVLSPDPNNRFTYLNKIVVFGISTLVHMFVLTVSVVYLSDLFLFCKIIYHDLVTYR